MHRSRCSPPSAHSRCSPPGALTVPATPQVPLTGLQPPALTPDLGEDSGIEDDEAATTGALTVAAAPNPLTVAAVLQAARCRQWASHTPHCSGEDSGEDTGED